VGDPVRPAPAWLWRGVLALTAVGIGVGAYLTATHYSDNPVLCAGLGSCAVVQASEYAKVGGVPVALLGLLLYLAIGAAALFAPRRPEAALTVFGLALMGTLYSAYLTYVEVAILGAVCLWCVASAVAIVGILALSGAAVLRQR
jgi:uncharacterized membrane protein